MRVWASAVVAVLAIVLGGDLANACSCGIATQPAEAYEEADLIFFGTVNRLHRGTGLNAKARRFWEFEVEGVWKGPAQPLIRIYAHDANAPQDTDDAVAVDSCDKKFEMGTSYIVYAYLRKGAPNRYRVNRCSRTTTAARSLRDIGFLGRPAHGFAR
jgi:hypothetical protein